MPVNKRKAENYETELKIWQGKNALTPGQFLGVSVGKSKVKGGGNALG